MRNNTPIWGNVSRTSLGNLQFIQILVFIHSGFMVSIDARESDPAPGPLPSKKRGTKPKQAKQHAMNGNHSDFHEGHDHLGMGRPAKQLSDEELHAQLKRKQQEAAITQQVRSVTHASASCDQHAVPRDASHSSRPSSCIGEVQKRPIRMWHNPSASEARSYRIDAVEPHRAASDTVSEIAGRVRR